MISLHRQIDGVVDLYLVANLNAIQDFGLIADPRSGENDVAGHCAQGECLACRSTVLDVEPGTLEITRGDGLHFESNRSVRVPFPLQSLPCVVDTATSR